MIDSELKIWAAGFFDGEGSALIEKTGVKSYTVVVAITATDEESIRVFQDNWGGRHEVKAKNYLASRTGGNVKRDGIWLWFNHAEAKHFLVDVYPFLITKRKDANVVLRALLALPDQIAGATGKKRVPRGSTVLLEPFYEELQSIRSRV